ncbi:MAG: DegT/DnrJ/EryC1/StrS family aminotransferase [Candidatus Hydrogenedentes bacterium]|nr:DegT/DnrJ/EryC1/StrS family aminotransferase [Candidatus Hydrogenedentota bacterium]
MIPYVELKTQFKAIETEIRAAIDTVLESGWFILGEQVRAFEQEFAAYLGVEHAVGVASGTDAIHLALRAAGVGPGDEVITAPNTCVPTVCGIAASGATPTLADVDPGTLTLDPAKLDAAITPRTRAIVPVHLYGHPCDMDPILEVARQHNLIVVEDCAQAHGARYKGALCGTFGHAAAFSFYPTKNLGAYGDGGAVSTSDAQIAEQVRRLRNYGEEHRYHHTVEGFNSRLDEIQAAVLRVKLPHLDAWNAARVRLAGAYGEALAETSVATPHLAPWALPNHHLYVVRTRHRDALQAQLKELGIGTLIHYPVPIHLQGAYSHLGLQRGAFPVAEQACGEVLSLPMYPELQPDAIPIIARAIADFRP